MGWITVAVIAALVAASCGSEASTDAVPTPVPATEEPVFDAPAAEPAVAIPPLRRDLSDVDLGDVVFDTFGRGELTLADASEADAAALLDLIPPLDDPPYEEADGGRWLASTDPVLGYVASSGQAYAYPHKILALHEIVNATIEGVPVLVSYCPLCNSGVIFDRRPLDLRHDGELTFSNTNALYDNDLVMVDRQTGTYWWQVPGRRIVGLLVGSELTVQPSQTMTWGQWLDLHPDTFLLSRDTGFIRDYEADRFLGYAGRVDAGAFPFPVQARARNDNRLSPATQVIGVDGADSAYAVPLGQEGSGVAELVVDGERVVILVQGGRFVDATTGSEFDLAGRAISGPLAGDQLEPAPSRSTFWFAYVAARPDVEVAQPVS